MRLIGHRGYHNSQIEANSERALKGCLEKKYGLETDLRDYTGKLVISHNPADEMSMAADELFKVAAEQKDCMLALNIKADGINRMLKEQLEKYSIREYFAFDMSVPQMIEYCQQGITFFTRKSEYEEKLVMYKEAAGVWVDAFINDEWINKELVEQFLNDGKKVCIVSPELHQKEYKSLWKRIKGWKINNDDLMLCTDLIDEAEAYFNKEV